MAQKHRALKVSKLDSYISAIRIAGFILSLIFLSNCSDNRVFDQNISMGQTGWAQKNVLKIPFHIEDTAKSYDLRVAIRQSNDYPFYNLYFVPQILNKDGKTIKRGLAEAFLYDAKTGKAKGSGLGDIFSHQYVIFRALKFEKPGNYSVTIEQFMRTDTLKGVVSLGASLIKNNQ